jgi:hypothetical protein
MDVYEILFQKCLEYEVIIDDKEIPLWKLKKENLDNVDVNVQWDSLQDLAISIYELKKEQQNSKELIKCPIEEILVAMAFLKSKTKGYLITDDMNNINTCLSHLSDLITARLNCIFRYYYLMKKPVNTNVFDRVILMFHQQKNIKVNNLNDFQNIVFKLKNLDFEYS